jgi:hypothetical protein
MSKQTKKRKSQFVEYTGVLANPIYLAADLSHLVDPSGNLERIERNRGIKELIAKLPALFKWYEIDMGSKDDWKYLALALAKAHVPGMRISKDPKSRRGPKPKWGPGLGDRELLRGVESRLKKGLSLKKAVEQLIKETKSRATVESLSTRFHEARRAEAQRREFEKLSQSDTPTGSLYRALGSYLESIEKRR